MLLHFRPLAALFGNTTTFALNYATVLPDFYTNIKLTIKFCQTPKNPYTMKGYLITLVIVVLGVLVASEISKKMKKPAAV